MTVTKIEPVNHKKSRIFIDEEFAFVLYKGEVRQYGIKEEEEISRQTYQEIMNELLPKRGKNRILYLLQSMDRTEGQLRLKLLNDGYPEAVIEEVLSFAKEYHYVDDERYVSNYFRQKSGKKSVQQIKAELLAKGISSEQICHVIEQSEPVDERAAIRRWIEKKNLHIDNVSREQIDKFCMSMMRKGFRYEDIRQELDVLMSE